MKHRPARKCACICAAKRLLAAQDRGRAMVRYRERELMVENQNARGQIRKNALEVHFRPLEGKAIGFHAAVRVLELARHRVERLGEHAELVAARHGRTARKSPRATACVACARFASGSARSPDCVAAAATAMKSAMSRANVSVTI